MAYGSVGAGNTGLTEVDVFIPEVWGQAVFGYLNRALRWRPLVDDYSSMVSDKGDRIHVPSISEVSVQTKAENTAVEYDAKTESKVTLVIDKH